MKTFTSRGRPQLHARGTTNRKCQSDTCPDGPPPPAVASWARTLLPQDGVRATPLLAPLPRVPPPRAQCAVLSLRAPPGPGGSSIHSASGSKRCSRPRLLAACTFPRARRALPSLRPTPSRCASAHDARTRQNAYWTKRTVRTAYNDGTTYI